MLPYRMPMLLITDLCVYCGNDATTRDHFIPLAQEKVGDANFEVPCCVTCNSTVNARFFATFDEKASWLLNRVSHRVNWKNLQQLAPLVVEALAQRAAGRNSAPVGVGMKTSNCDTCGQTLSRPYRSQNARAFCSRRCVTLFKLDENRRRKYRNAPRKRTQSELRNDKFRTHYEQLKQQQETRPQTYLDRLLRPLTI